MNVQFDNSLYMSFFLWAEHRLLNNAQAYITTTQPLFYTPDPQLPSAYVAYSSPFKSWVYDSGVSGSAIVIQTISGSTGVLHRSSGMHIDYGNGRVILPAAMGTNLTLTGTFSMYELNCYSPNESEDWVLTQFNRYFLNPRFNGVVSTSGVPPYQFTLPAVFMNTLHSANDAFALGGLDDSTTTMSIVAMVESNYQLNAVLSLFRDARYQYFPLLNILNDPIDGFGDVVGGLGYNYNNYISAYGTPGNLVYIKAIRTSKVSDKVNVNPQIFAGIIDLDVSYIRQTL